MKAFKITLAAAALSLLAVPAMADIVPNAKETPSFNQFSSSYRQPEILAPAYVTQVQQALADRGFYDGPVDGKWGNRTTAAIRRYQRSVGSQPTGLLTTTTLDNLGVYMDDRTRETQMQADETLRRNMRSNEH